jgi:[ribosomal protein S5]-alanine N-acetyltransferase
MVTSKKRRIADILLTGLRIYLRSPKQRDCDELLALNRASVKFHRGLVTPPTRPEQFKAYLKRCRQPDCIGLLIFRLEDDSLIGRINISQIVRGSFHSAYLGYELGAPYAGQGYMTEALNLVLRYLFNDLKMHRLEANIQPHNIPSITLVKRAGFSLEGYSRRYLKIAGRWRDHERWAILVEDWRAKRQPNRG